MHRPNPLQCSDTSTAPRPVANLYEGRYVRLETLLGEKLADFSAGATRRLTAPGLMDLVVEGQPPCSDTGGRTLMLAHYFRFGDQTCEDPAMTLRYFPPGDTAVQDLIPSTDPQRGRLEVLSFIQAVPFVFLDTYPHKRHFVPALRDEVNRFLGQWLQNLEIQGYRPATGLPGAA